MHSEPPIRRLKAASGEAALSRVNGPRRDRNLSLMGNDYTEVAIPEDAIVS